MPQRQKSRRAEVMQTWQMYLENGLETYTDINFFPYFGIENTLLKFVQAFKMHPVCEACTRACVHVFYSVQYMHHTPNLRAKFIKPNNRLVHKKKLR
jgi:hypothetical protein